MGKSPCYICSTSAVVGQLGEKDAFHVQCPVCGKYSISGTLGASTIVQYGEPYRISAALRRISDAGSVADIGTGNIKNLAESVSPPKDPLEAIDRLLQSIVERSERSDRFVPISYATDYPLVCAQNPSEFQYYVEKAGDLRYLEQHNEPSGASYRLSLEGWKHFAQIRSAPTQSDVVFVAMWFDKSLDTIWDNGFKPAIHDAGLKPLRIDLQEHNEKICDRIIAEIRTCSFMVADFTGQRGGVYFEAGFAMGQGKPVIWTVREGDMAQLHFDTRQYNHIPWLGADDLHKKLLNRIRATIPIGTSIKGG
jgi:hypothetical protein